MAVKLVVFDMAGTTVADNNNVAQTLQDALQHFGFHLGIEDINIVMGHPKPVAIKTLLEKRIGATASQALIDDVYSLFEEKMINYYQHSSEVAEQEGASQVFMKLKEHAIKVGIDTGFSRNVANAIIDRLGWTNKQLIDISVTSDEVEKGRPHPDMIFKAMSVAGIDDASEVAKVGDTISDLHEGSAAGCRYVIGIQGKANTADELRNEPHTHIISNISEVTDIILQ